MTTKTVYPIEVDHTYTAKQHFDIKKYHLKKWGGFDTMKKPDGKITCGTGNYPKIGSKNDLFNKPAPVYVNFGSLNIPNGSKLGTVKLHMNQNTICTKSDKKSSNYPSFGAPTIKSYNKEIENNQVKAEVVTGIAPTADNKEVILEFKNLTAHDVNVSDFGFLIIYPANTSQNQGQLTIGNIYLELETDAVDIDYTVKANPETVDIGQKFELELHVEQRDMATYTPVFELNFNNVLRFDKKISGDGTFKNIGTDKEPQYQWTSTLTKKQATIKLQFTAIKTGTYEISMIDALTNNAYTINLPILQKELSCKSTCRLAETPNIKRIKQDERAIYQLSTKTRNSLLDVLPITLHFPLCAEFENIKELEEENNFKWTADKTEKKVTMNADIVNLESLYTIALRFNDSGVYPIQAEYNGKIVDTCYVTVLPKNYTKMAYTKLEVTDEDILEALSTNLDYTAISHAKYIYTDDDEDGLLPELGEYQVRFGVYNLNDDVSEEEFLANTEWSQSRETNVLDEYRVNFHYFNKYPLYFVWTIDYIESPFYEKIKVEFSEPELYETKNNTSYNQEPALYPKPVINHILSSGEQAVVELPSKKSTNIVRCHNFNEQVVFSNEKNVVCQGMQVEWEYETNQQIEMIIEVKANTYETGTFKGLRSITLPAPKTGETVSSGIEAIGGKWDLYGLSPHYFRSDTLNYLWVDIHLNNPNNVDATVKLSNIKLKLFLMDFQDQEYSFEVDGERAEDYGIFFKKMTWDWGTQNEVNYYQTSGTDITTAYRSNINKKDLELEFDVGNCDLHESGVLLEKVTKLFTNKRTLFNKPIPKRIIFDHLPEYEFWFVREDALEVEEEYGAYTVKCKLVIPEGTARNRTVSITGTTGANTGVARVSPTIDGIANNNGIITITESNSKQSMTLKTDDIKIGDSFTIDCMNRKAYLSPNGTNTLKDITNSILWNSNWFIIEDEYTFKSPDSNITMIRFQERK